MNFYKYDVEIICQNILQEFSFLDILQMVLLTGVTETNIFFLLYFTVFYDI